MGASAALPLATRARCRPSRQLSCDGTAHLPGVDGTTTVFDTFGRDSTVDGSREIGQTDQYGADQMVFGPDYTYRTTYDGPNDTTTVTVFYHPEDPTDPRISTSTFTMAGRPSGGVVIGPKGTAYQTVSLTEFQPGTNRATTTLTTIELSASAVSL